MDALQVGGLTVAVGALTITAAACATDRAELSSASAETRSALRASNLPVVDRVVLGEGRDRTASQTVGDWVTYADHVFVVTVVNEVRHTPSQPENERGRG